MRMSNYLVKISLLLCVSFVFAPPAQRTCAQIVASGNIDTIGGFLCSIKENSFRGIYTLVYILAYVSGFAVIGNAIFKLKQVKDNPTQIPVSTPIALFVCGTLLILMPSLIIPIGNTMFGSASLDTAYTNSATGVTEDVNSGSVIPPNLLDKY